MSKSDKSDLLKFSEEYIRDVQELTRVISHKYPTLNIQQHTMMANDIRKAYAIESKLTDILDGVDGVYETIISED